MKPPNKSRSIDKGAVAEQKVAAELLLRGYYVNWSTSDKLPYDFVIDADGKLLKIQVKGIFTKGARGSYGATIGHGKDKSRQYKRNEVDFYIIYIHPENIYYVIPFMEGFRNFSLTNPAKCKYTQYREAWELL